MTWQKTLQAAGATGGAARRDEPEFVHDEIEKAGDLLPARIVAGNVRVKRI